MGRKLMAIFLVGLALAGCNRSQAGTTTSTSFQPAAAPTSSPTTSPPGTATTAAEGGGPTTVPATPGYSIVSRTPGDDGDAVVVLVEPGDYTDMELESVILDVAEDFAPILEAHLVDSQEAAEAVLEDEPTPEQRSVLEEHYFARLENGNRLTFLGPYAQHGERLLGS